MRRQRRLAETPYSATIPNRASLNALRVSVCSGKGELGPSADDEVWIPSAASRHGVVITQDVNIHRTRAQWERCQANKIGVFFFRPPKKAGWSYWQIVQLVVRHWPEIKRLSEAVLRGNLRGVHSPFTDQPGRPPGEAG